MCDSHNTTPDVPTMWLASKSPRRRLLLQEANIPHTTINAGIDDANLKQGNVTIEMWTIALAYLKAKSAACNLKHMGHKGIVLGADTLVSHQGIAIGQPTDVQHAKHIINTLNNARHDVITGVAIIDIETEARTLFADITQVNVGSIDDNSINQYLNTDLWQGKAGAYNLSDRINAGWPITIQGDPGTVMGLPMIRLTQYLYNQFGIHFRESTTQ